MSGGGREGGGSWGLHGHLTVAVESLRSCGTSHHALGSGGCKSPVPPRPPPPSPLPPHPPNPAIQRLRCGSCAPSLGPNPPRASIDTNSRTAVPRRRGARSPGSAPEYMRLLLGASARVSGWKQASSCTSVAPRALPAGQATGRVGAKRRADGQGPCAGARGFGSCQAGAPTVVLRAYAPL
jgi:hypothetical protein